MQMRMRKLGWLLPALLLGACSVDRQFDGAPPKGPLAVGATAIGGAASESCRHGERGSWCDSNPVEILALSSTPAGIFELTHPRPGGAVDVRALAEGTALLSITASDGLETRTFTGELRALSINSVLVTPVNKRAEPCSEPLLFATDTSLDLPFELRHDSIVLLGSGVYPFEAAGFTLSAQQIY